MGTRALAVAIALSGLLLCPRGTAAAETSPERADVALVLALDVSGSMDAHRYALQMEGIARALEDPDVEAGMLSGPHHAMLLAVVEWSNRPTLNLPWTLITSPEDARAAAEAVRHMARSPGEFTCMSTAVQSISDKVIPSMPVPADRTVVDVSGDGHDNCNEHEPMQAVRDDLAARHITVNGLPILGGDETDTLEGWYRRNVVGGPEAFEVPAKGYDDFGRAIREKFVLEISGRTPPLRFAADE